MKLYSTTQAAKLLGIDPKSLSRYIAAKKVPTPKVLESGKIIHHIWTEEEVENLRQLLPRIANGRKTRYSKLREKETAQPRAAVPHKSRKPKKKSRTKLPRANG
jgi:predicted transcriptional regulator